MQRVASFATLIAFCLTPLLARAAEPSQWEAAIAKFEAQDAKNPPLKGGIVFVGSSSIRLWDTEKAFPDLKTINRGFGGSQVADSVEFADRIVIPYAPKTVVFYAGDNDLAADKTPEEVFADYKRFVEIVRAALPDTQIIYVGIKPSLARWNLIDEVREANAKIRAYAETHERLAFLDVDAPMIGPDGKPRAELFVQDGLHLNEAGYELWNSLLRPLLTGAGNLAGK